MAERTGFEPGEIVHPSVDSRTESTPPADASAREQNAFGPDPAAGESPRIALVRALASSLPLSYAAGDRAAVRAAMDALHALLDDDGAPALSIQKLAGHEDLATTLGYMHLAKGETERAIRLLELPGYGNLTATETDGKSNSAT